MNFEKIREAIATQLDISEDEITLESRLVEDLSADSLDLVELVMDLESEFGVEIPDDELPSIHTVGDILKYVEKK